MTKPTKEEWARLQRDYEEFTEKSAERIGGATALICPWEKSLHKNVAGVIQLALAVLLDKPLYLLIPRGVPIGAKLKALADGIEYFDLGDLNSQIDAGKRLLLRALEGQKHGVQ